MLTIKEIEEAFMLQGYYSLEDAVKYDCKIEILFRDLYEQRDRLFSTGEIETDDLLEKARSYVDKGELDYARSFAWRAVLAALVTCDEEAIQRAAEFYMNVYGNGSEEKASKDSHIATLHDIMVKKQCVMDSVKEIWGHYGCKG